MAHFSPGRQRTANPLVCAQPNSASGRLEPCRAAVSWVSARCDGPRSAELASRYAYGPPIAPAGPSREGRRSETSTKTPAAMQRQHTKMPGYHGRQSTSGYTLTCC